MDDHRRLGAVSAELIRAGLEGGTSFRFRISSESMRPTLRAGDDVLVSKVDWRRLRMGDIVLCDTGRLLVAHRLLAIRSGADGPELLTKGDATRRADARCALQAYRGRITRVERGGRAIDLDDARRRLAGRTRAGISLGQAMLIQLYDKLKRGAGLAALLACVLLLLVATRAAAAVTISSFTATGGNNQIQLKWSTALELKNFGFNLERSLDKVAWNKITFVGSQSPCVQSLEQLDYTYTDGNLSTATKYYYRLQMVGSPCGDPDLYYDQVVNATTNGANPSSTTTPAPSTQPSNTPTATRPGNTPTATTRPSNTPHSTATNTRIPPTATATNTPIAPTATATNSAVPPTATASDTAVPPIDTPTNTAVPPTATATASAAPVVPTAAAYPLPAQSSPTALLPTPVVEASATPAASATAQPVVTEVAIVVPTEVTRDGGDTSTQGTTPANTSGTNEPGDSSTGAAEDTAQGNGALPFAAAVAALALLGGAGLIVWRGRRMRPLSVTPPPSDEV